MSKRILQIGLLILAVAVLTAGNCKKKNDVETQPPPAPTPAPTQPAPKPEPVEVDDNDGWQQEEPEVQEQPLTLTQLNEQLRTAYFEFDEFDLTDSARATIQANARVIKDNPDYGVVVEGHCDERGTIEYNISLGEKRARAVRDYLGSLGVRTSRIRIVTYGEERPADPGHTESAWAKNRRAEFKFE